MVYRDKINSLTEMNRFLREKMNELQDSNNGKLIEREYEKLQEKYSKLEVEMIDKV